MNDNNVLECEFPIYFLDCKESFTHLSNAEKNYAYALVKAGWNGALINLVQCSSESPGLFIIAQKIFRNQSSEEIEELIKSIGYDATDARDFLNYFVMVYDNLGNYRSFGDSKFIPRLAKDKFDAIVIATKGYKIDPIVKEVFDQVRESVYLLSDRNKQFGFGKDGISTYYSFNCCEEDAKLVQSYLDANNISSYNTRVFKTLSNECVHYQVRQASSDSSTSRNLIGPPGENVSVSLINGDYAELMALMVNELNNARELSLNTKEQKMLEHYIKSFTSGSIDEHKEGSRYWIQDKGPVVENYIGFIESYRDPLGVRGEFEAFIAVVDKKQSEKFERLVASAPGILKELPWAETYEKDTFLQPDFTSLDIINFANSGIPVGINIPNYDDIRQSEGFKNVSLGNVLKSRFKDPKAIFLRDNDRDLYIKRAAEAFEVQVGLHELIGHGSGKLFYFEKCNFNFDLNIVRDAITNGPVKSWYKDNETWDSVFTSIASPFEECRAECVGLYLCSLSSVLAIFGHSQPDDAKDVFYVNWLSMVKSALISMEFYTPSQQKWRQAHCQARYVILQVLLEAGDGLLQIKEVKGSDDKPDLEVHLDRSKIETIGRKAIGNFLKLLQYYKSTANYIDGSAFFSRYSIMDHKFLLLRDIVLARKSPRPAMIQSVVCDSATGPKLLEYPNTVHGMIQSFKDRFHGEFGDKALAALFKIWKRDQNHFLL